MDLDNFIIGKTNERRGEERGDLAKKKQQLLSRGVIVDRVIVDRVIVDE